MNFIKIVLNLLDILLDVKLVNQAIIKNGVIKKQKQKRRLNEKNVVVVENLKVLIHSINELVTVADIGVCAKNVLKKHTLIIVERRKRAKSRPSSKNYLESNKQNESKRANRTLAKARTRKRNQI